MYSIKDRLGVDICDRSSRCPFCHAVQDLKGTHAKGCMAGGDTAARHDGVREITYDHGRSGNLQPKREPSHVMARPEGSTEPSQRRPADVLIPHWPERKGAGGCDKVALDFAVINALAPAHFDTTLRGSGTTAATAYAQAKRDYQGTAARCEQEGIALHPVVFTAQGAVDPNASKTLEVLHRAVAGATGAPLAEVRKKFDENVSMHILKANARAVHRRHPDGPIAAQRGPTALVRQRRRALGNVMSLQGIPEEPGAG